MDLTSLNVFVDVIEKASFTAVARDRGVTPSNISRTVASLEVELGVRLFQRNTRRIVATQAGSLFFERIKPLVDELNRAKLMANELSAAPKGVLRVTAPVTFGQFAIVPLIPEFSQRWPDLSIDLRLEDAVVDMLSERIDVAIRLGQLPSSDFVATRLCSMRYVACASPHYLDQHGRPEHPSELEKRECLRLPLAGFNSVWQFRDANHEISDVSISGKVVTSNVLALMQCCLAGMGIALLPRWAVARKLHDGSLIDLFPDLEAAATSFDSSAWMLYPSRVYLPRNVSTFVRFVKERLSLNPPWEAPEYQAPIDLLPFARDLPPKASGAPSVLASVLNQSLLS